MQEIRDSKIDKISCFWPTILTTATFFDFRIIIAVNLWNIFWRTPFICVFPKKTWAIKPLINFMSLFSNNSPWWPGLCFPHRFWISLIRSVGDLSVGRLSVIKSWLFIPYLLSSSGIVASISLSMHMNFVRWHPSAYTFVSYHLPVWMHFRGYLQTLASHPRKTFFSKFPQHHCHILFDYLMLFFWECSCCSLMKNYHQKNFIFFCNLCFVEHSLYVCHYSKMFFSKLD